MLAVAFVRRRRCRHRRRRQPTLADLARRLEINEVDRAVLTLKTQARKLEQQRTRVGAGCSAGPLACMFCRTRLRTAHASAAAGCCCICTSLQRD